MKNVIVGAVSCSNSPAQSLLSAHRRNLLDLLAGEPTITTAEYDTAVQNILACHSLPTLQKWYVNIIREVARREEAAGMAQPTAPVVYATASQKEEIQKLANSVWILRKEKVQALLTLPALTDAGAVALIGDLWATILRRQERAAEGHEGASQSVSEAC